MKQYANVFTAYAIMIVLIILVGVFQSWTVALSILNFCLVSAVMTMGANIQWGYAGLINFGIMGYTALGGLAAVLVSVAPVQEAWSVGGLDMIICLGIIVLMVFSIRYVLKKIKKSKKRNYIIAAIIIAGLIILRIIAGPATEHIEAVNPAKTGFLGGLGMPILFSWIVGAFFAGGLAYIVGKVALGLRADYLAIATLLISEIVIAVIKHEDWLSRGVKNVNGLPRPVPYEIELQSKEWVLKVSDYLDTPITELSSIMVKLSYSILFFAVLLIVLFLLEIAVKSPWGRMMRAIRDNEVSANAMGKNIKQRHLQVFVIGSAIVGLAGAMLTTLDGQFTPVSYQPLRYTFLIWIMVIVGGSGNNFGSIIGGFLIWFFWVQSEPLGLWFISQITTHISDTNIIKSHLLENAAHIRLMFMGMILLITLRFAPKGLIPEVKR